MLLEREILNLKENYENDKLKEYLLDDFNENKSIETTDKIIQKYSRLHETCFQIGRAHFYAPYKHDWEYSDRYSLVQCYNVMVCNHFIILLYIIMF